ncbi:hypothetical protein LH464_04170 [Neorhizobium sp. T786]|uniref:hypothetical protein n=1 Tax=Pseudorhizobium xiangyangii TaxID=2883104 RepID=UPI001CFF834E|nr:hypothetical protein [Neorhizobium xiangyangii]MCB5201673.1 hypothetical protein [Neorhizobium xiangyangii]
MRAFLLKLLRWSSFITFASTIMIFLVFAMAGGTAILLSVSGYELGSAVMADVATGLFGAFIVALAGFVLLSIIIRLARFEIEPFIS